MNQVTETHRVSDLAHLVAQTVGAQISAVSNPRAEADENQLSARNDHLLGLGLEPTRLASGLLHESVEIAQKYAARVDVSRIPCTSYWNRDRRTSAQEHAHE